MSKVVLSSVAASVPLPLGATLHLPFAFVAFGGETGDRFDVLALKTDKPRFQEKCSHWDMSEPGRNFKSEM